MSVKLHKERIKMNEILCSEYGQATAESDIIVPDINPDVLKILRVSARAYVTQKNVQQDRAYIQGVIKLNILYVPESFECGKIKAINTSLDFSHIAEAKGAKPGMCINAEAECESISDTLVNSRKLNVKCTVGVSVKICACSEKELAVSVPEEDNLELKCSKLKLINYAADADREFVISERLDLPAGKPHICEILKLGAAASTAELRITEGKAVVRGELKLSVLYSGAPDHAETEADDGSAESIEFAEYTLPFTEVFDSAGLKEGMEGEIDYCIKDINCSAQDGENGENTCLNADIIVGALVKATELTEISVIEDAYSTTSNISPKKKAYDIERLLDSGYIQIPQKEILEIPDYLPEIQKVCDISAVPSVTDISVSGDCATVKGIISVNLLYITRSPELPVAGFDKTFEFTHSFELCEPCEDSVCEAKITGEHLSYTLSGDRALELRLINSLSIKCMASDKTEFIDEIEEDDAPLRELPPVIIYFVQPGDTLWDIAKRFRSSSEKIAADNSISDNLIKPGQKLMIFR